MPRCGFRYQRLQHRLGTSGRAPPGSRNDCHSTSDHPLSLVEPDYRSCRTGMHPARRVCGGRHPGVGFAAAGARRAVRERVVNISGGRVMGAFVRVHRRGLVGVLAIVLAAALALPVTAAKRSGAAQRLPETGRYVVQLNVAAGRQLPRRHPRHPGDEPDAHRAQARPPLTGRARLPRLPRRPPARRARAAWAAPAAHPLLLPDRLRRLRRPPDRRAGRRAAQGARAWRA